MQLTVRQPSAALDAKHYTTERLRSEYVIEKIFVADEAMFTYSHFDRIIAGGVMPVNTAVELVGCKELCSDTFLERREMGVINIGGKGGDTILSVCNAILADEFPELAKKVEVMLPDEKTRRVGQSVAAATLPEIRK